jgi:fatty-acid desaturase
MVNYFSKLGSKRLVLLQIVAHLSLILMWQFGTAAEWAISVLVYFFTGGIGMAIIGHRWLSHKSFNAPRWFQIFGTLCGCLGGIGSPLAWVAIHRQHHRYVDRPGDPHSPVVEGILKVQFKTMLARPKWRYVRDLLQDPVQRFFLKNHWKIQFLYVFILLAINPFAVVFCYLVPATYLWNIGAALNVICHQFGYRNYPSKDNSFNNPLMALLMWGEGWHNNHHANPSDWNCGHRWFEIDICSWVIRLVDKDARTRGNKALL